MHSHRANTNALLERWLFFPQHMGTNHWALLAVHLPSHHIHLLDSLIRSDHAEYLIRIRTLKEVLNKAWDMTSDTPPPIWQHTIRTDSPRQTNSVDRGVYMLAFCILLYTNNELRFSTNMARHWRSRMALLYAHWTPSSPYSTASAPTVTLHYPPTQTSSSPPQSSPPDKDIIAAPPPKPKPDSTTTPSSVKVVSTDTPKPIRASPSGRGDRGIGGGLGEKGGGKREVRKQPDKGRPHTRRTRTNAENSPVGTKRKRATPAAPVDAKEPQHRKHKKSRQVLMSAFIRK